MIEAISALVTLVQSLFDRNDDGPFPPGAVSTP